MTDRLREQVSDVLEAHWRDGYTVPNATVYPWMWLWDSCFHVVIWSALGDTRSVIELETVFTHQSPGGFVPHMGYQADPSAALELWGRTGASVITQPPMFGHAVAVLERAGVTVPDAIRAKAAAGLRWLAEHRVRDDGRLVIVHPWESGCDDSPAWDSWCPGPFDRSRWRARKQDLVRVLDLDEEMAATGSPAFEVESPGFSALTLFNASELGIALPAIRLPVVRRPRTLDDALVALVDDRPDLLELALDDTVFGGPYGPAGVRRDDPAFDPSAYWRGAAWPQLTYLLHVAAHRWGHRELADRFAARLVAGAEAAALAEYWNPDSGAGLGAQPQTWSGLAVAVAPRN